jgi:hypothetical protein
LQIILFIVKRDRQNLPGGLQIILFIVERDSQKARIRIEKRGLRSVHTVAGTNEDVPLPFHLRSSSPTVVPLLSSCFLSSHFQFCCYRRKGRTDGRRAVGSYENASRSSERTGTDRQTDRQNSKSHLVNYSTKQHVIAVFCRSVAKTGTQGFFRLFPRAYSAVVLIPYL